MNLLAGRPGLQDALLAAIASGLALAMLIHENDRSDASALSYVAIAVAGLALLRRRRWPIAVLAIVVAARVTMTWDSIEEALAPAAMIAFYTVARTGKRQTSLGLAAVLAALTAVAVASLVDDPFLPEAAGDVALMLLPVALGDAARSRADRLRDMINAEADQRVADERLRIARDLHDVVAHGLSTIAVQSGVAAHLIERDPQQAKEALETINSTGKSALEELRSMVGVLRSTDDAPLRPAPTEPDDLTQLIAGASDAGLTVTTTTAGHFPANVAESCVVAVHRITQEALTNVARHAGPVAVHIDVRHGDNEVQLTVTNPPGTIERTLQVPSTGVGIIGMTERAEALGGNLTAAPTNDGGFRVFATIPYNHRPSDQAPL